MTGNNRTPAAAARTAAPDALQRLRARVTELEAENARLRASQPGMDELPVWAQNELRDARRDAATYRRRLRALEAAQPPPAIRPPTTRKESAS